jgi:hypothetical protein
MFTAFTDQNSNSFEFNSLFTSMIVPSMMMMTILISFGYYHNEFYSISNHVGSAFKKQASIATALADMFNSFKRFLNYLSINVSKHCDDFYSARVSEKISLYLWIIYSHREQRDC